MAGEGYGVNAFLDTMRQAEAAAVNRRIAEQGLAERGAAMQQQQAVPGALSALAGASDSRVVEPGAPAVPPSVTETQGAPATDLEGNAVGNESTITATPGQDEKPEVRAHGTTLSALVKELGADKVNTLLSTPQGRDALSRKGVLSDQAASDQETDLKAVEGYKKKTKASWDAYASGDVVQGAMLRARAAEDLALTVKDPHKSQMARTLAQEFEKAALEMQRNEEERTRANGDYTKIAPAMIAFNKPGGNTAENLTNLITAYSDVQSKWAIAERDRFLSNLTTSTIKGMDSGLNELYNEAGKVLLDWKKQGKKTADGKEPNVWHATNEVLADRPELFAPLMHAWLHSKPGEFPADGAAIIFGQSAKFHKDDYQAADILARAKLGLGVSEVIKDPAMATKYGEEMQKQLARIHRGLRLSDPMHRMEVTQLVQGMHEDIAEAQKIEKQLADPGSKFTMKTAEREEAKQKAQFYRQRAEATRRRLEAENFRTPAPPGSSQSPGLKQLPALQWNKSADEAYKAVTAQNPALKTDRAKLKEAISAYLQKQNIAPAPAQ